VKKFLTVATTAALVLTATGAPAFAQDETIKVEGLVFLDRNLDRVFDAGDSARANGPGVRVINQDTDEIVGDFGTGADGRYRAVLPKGPEYTVAIWDFEYSFNRVSYDTVTESKSDADFALFGHIVNGFSFVDANGDGVKQTGEKTSAGRIKVTGTAAGGRAVELEAQPGADGAYSLDLPNGEFTVTAADLTPGGLTLAEPKSDHDIDWLTGSRKIQQMIDHRTHRVDLRYAEAKADIALETAITPAKETYTRGDQIDLKLTLSNKGNVPVAPTFVLGSFQAKLVSYGDNVTLRPGTDEDFTVVDKILPGKQLDVALKIELNDLEYNEVHAMARFNFGRLPDVNHKNNVAIKQIKVVEKGASTAPATPSSETAVAPTTTTDPAVAKAGNNSGLASTGASPLGFLGLGALLLAAGTAAFFVARRRRS
jgi:hypothetical protein